MAKIAHWTDRQNLSPVQANDSSLAADPFGLLTILIQEIKTRDFAECV